MISKKALAEIEKIVQEEMASKNNDLYRACKKLAEYTVGRLPESCMNEEDGYEEGDEDAPFFSECYLYNLLGKDDARTLLALMRPIWEAAGIETEVG